MKQLALFVSTIFHPLLMPVYTIWLLFIYSHFGASLHFRMWNILIPVIVCSIAIPLVMLSLMYKFRIITDLSIENKKERLFPYIICIVSSLVMTYLYFKMHMPEWFLMMNLSLPVALFIAMFITLIWKISAHMMGIGGLAGSVMSICFFIEQSNQLFLISIIILVSGLLGTARLALNRHTLLQVVCGFLLGFSCSFTLVWLGA